MGIGEQLQDWRLRALQIEEEISHAVIGQFHAIRLINVALFARGHVLLEGGVGVGMAEGVVQGFLHDAIDGQARFRRKPARLADHFELAGEAVAVDLVHIALDGRFHAEVIEVRRSQGEDDGVQLIHRALEQIGNRRQVLGVMLQCAIDAMRHLVAVS